MGQVLPQLNVLLDSTVQPRLSSNTNTHAQLVSSQPLAVLMQAVVLTARAAIIAEKAPLPATIKLFAQLKAMFVLLVDQLAPHAQLDRRPQTE